MLYDLNTSGLPVWIRLENTDILVHAKMMIVDRSVVILGSENYFPTSYPPNTDNITCQPYTRPSRGWGAIIYNSTFARICESIFEDIFLNDSRSVDYDPLVHGTGTAPDENGNCSIPKSFDTTRIYDYRISLVYSPVNSYDTIKWLIDHANHTIFIETMYINNSSYYVQDLINRLKSAVNRGVTVQLILEDDTNVTGNYSMMAPYLNSLGIHVVPAFSLDEGIFLHNKGIIVDDEYVVVGSINWSGASLTLNTEVGILIRSREAALFFKEVFEYDWNKSTNNVFDTDGDGLSDIFEIEHNTDPYKIDTDGDGVDDYGEVFVYGTDPARADVIIASIISPNENAYISSTDVEIRWEITHIEFVTGIEVRVDSNTISSLSPDINSYVLHLSDQATHIVEIIPKTSTGFSVISARAYLHIDTQAPEVTIISPKNNTNIKDIQFTLTANIHDFSPTQLVVKLNGTTIYLENRTDTDYSISIPITVYKKGTYLIDIEVEDKAGNKTKKTLIIHITQSETTPTTTQAQGNIWGKEVPIEVFVGLIIIIILVGLAVIIIYTKKS